MRGFAVKTPIDSQAHARKLEEKLTQFHEQSQALMTKHIKNTMSQFYFAMRDSLDAEETYGGQDILAAVLDSIKESTYEALRSLDSDFAMEEVLQSKSDDAPETENLDATDLGLNESVMDRDIQALCREYQILDQAVVLPPKVQEPEEEEEEEEVVEEAPEEPEEPSVEEEEEEPRQSQAPEEASEEQVVEEEEEDDVEDQVDDVPAPEEDEYEEVEVEEEEEEAEVLEEEDVEVEDAEVDDTFESEEQDDGASTEQEEVEEKREAPSDPLSAASPEPSPVSTPTTRRRPVSLFGEEEDDDLFSSSSSKKKASPPVSPAPVQSASTSQEEDPLISKFSTTSRPKVDLFGSDDDFFSAPKSSQKRGVSNLDNIFGGGSSGSSTKKDFFGDW